MIFKSKIINHNDSQILLKVKNTLVIHVVFTVIALDEFSFFFIYSSITNYHDYNPYEFTVIALDSAYSSPHLSAMLRF